jgi:hypothetical protein
MVELSVIGRGVEVISNVERYKKDISSLVSRAVDLENALQSECSPAGFRKEVEKQYGSEKATEFLKRLPSFDVGYQSWYSEAKAVIKQLLPDRLADFVHHYEAPKSRKTVDGDTYRIEDCLLGRTVTRTNGYLKDVIVNREAAIPHFRQQRLILAAVAQRFESSLFDIRLLLQGDLFDSELEAAKELAKNKFMRAAGALAGVVLEKHLGEVCDSHSDTIKIMKKNPTISVFNDALKDAAVIDIPQWRFIQHLGDIRNLCDHGTKVEPTSEQVKDLIEGVTKAIKTIS